MGQNTLVLNLDTALRLMGDVAEYYVDHDIRNHYFVSISGYHIAEAGANPITQAALTLSNGLTYVELFKSRDVDPEKFLRNFSWFSPTAWIQSMRSSGESHDASGPSRCGTCMASDPEASS